MAGLYRNSEGTREGKYLVKRRDGTVPKWPWFVLGAIDPAAPHALWAYAARARNLGMDPAYCDDVHRLGNEFSDWLMENGKGDPGAPRHRKDDPGIIAEMSKGNGAIVEPVASPSSARPSDQELKDRFHDEFVAGPHVGEQWQHYRNLDHYEIVSVSLDAANRDPVVTYRSLRTRIAWSRPLSEFLGAVTHHGSSVTRFSRLDDGE